MKNQFNAIFAIASRDFIKFLRDKPRIIATFMFPIIFIGVLGNSLQANLGKTVGFNLLLFVFTGVIGQTLFQSTAAGIISLIQDRETDFAQEMFVAPVYRYAIFFGKILGESLVSLSMVVGIVVFSTISRVPFSYVGLVKILPVVLVACFLGGAFGILVLSQLGEQRSVQQVFPFVIFPQFFLSGVFSPIQNLPPVLFVLSRIVPMTYAVDLIRGMYYIGTPDYDRIVLHHPATNLLIIAIYFTIMLVIGTFLFIRNEREK